MALAFINVVVDAIIIVQSRKDEVHGSQDLMSIAWMAMGVGGVSGCVAGGYLTQYCHPKYTFVIVSIVGLIIALIGTTLTKESEKAGEDDQNDQNFITKFNQNLS